MIESRTTRRFREAFEALPEDTRRQARQAYRLFSHDPSHPSLRFKKVDDGANIYSIRVGIGYRALGVMTDSAIVWFWIGSHADYDHLV